MLAQEGERWLVTLAGYFGDHAPATEAGFLAFAQSLATADVYDVIKDAEPLSDFATYKYAANQRRRYERLTRFPEGLLVFGDAICSFNPAYGQGMSSAALQAVELRKELTSGRVDLAPRFFKSAARVIDNPWDIAVGGDLKMPETEGRRTVAVRLINWYVSRLHKLGHRDPGAAAAFVRVAQMRAAPESIMRPRLAAKVLLNNLRRWPAGRAESRVAAGAAAQYR